MLAIGRYNVAQGDPMNWVGTDDLFVIGNGTGDYTDEFDNWFPPQPHNAFVVKKNGDTMISGKVLIHPQGDLSMGEFTSGTAPQ